MLTTTQSRNVRRAAALFALTAIALGAGCKKSEPHTEDIFQAQTLGLGYLDRGQLVDAETQFKSVVSMAPDEPLGHAYLGLTYLRGSRFADAEKELRRAHELDAANADVDLMLGKLYAVTGRPADARNVLEQASRSAPNNAHVLYALASLDGQAAAGDTSKLGAYEQSLRKALTVAPLNVPLRLQLADVLLRRGQSDSVVHHLEEVRRAGPDIPADARPALDTTIAKLQSGKQLEARAAFDRFSHAMSTTSEYQTSLNDVKWLDGPLSGTPTLAYMPKSLSQLRGVARGNSAPDVRFSDATGEIGFAAGPSEAIAVGDVDGDGTEDLFIGGHLYHVQGGQALDVSQRAGLAELQTVFATFADLDNDGRLDLFAIGTDGHARVFHNDGGSRFTDVSARSGINNVFGARKAIFADLDHDGDLDLLLVGGARIAFYRNNADGTFTEMADAMGFNTSRADTRDAAFADFDGDGRIDVLVVNAGGAPTLYHNEGGRRFADATSRSGLASSGGSVVRAADYDNDGTIDVLIAGGGGEPSLWLNAGDGTFRRDTRSAAALRVMRGTVSDVQFVDYDNDGWLDLVAVGDKTWLLRNDGHGRFEDRSIALPPSVKSGAVVAPIDIDNDGDMDLIIGDHAGAHLLRNDNGNARLSMQVRLTGLRTGSGKNNDFGIGARLEVRAGDLYQTRVVTTPTTHFGLGPHLKADVVRIEWTNGVPQTVFFPGTDQDVIENEVLKGSCAFLYTWDGARFRFVTDVMWRSALGMPMGLMAGGMSHAAAYAPAGASQEYLRIPGDALKPRDGKYRLQLTEELWETAFADQLELYAVDHPDSVQIFVDEKFVPPGPVKLRMFNITHPRPPVSAVDDRGNDVLPALRALDDHYVSNLTPLEFQGVVAPHDLIMDLGDDAGAPDTYLFLRGWIYPTDASINVSLSQRRGGGTTMPSLDVRDAGGKWVNAIPSLSFPSGKSKTLVVPLGGIFRTSDHHVRIRTNMQIYWDQAFTAGDSATRQLGISATPERLRMTKADLHFRGYSRTYRKGGRYGPWWFDYDSVTRASPWRPITGAFTRFGDVMPLLRSSDDMYVIMAPGDEATLEFDAPAPPPAGWTRDFLLYTDGWIKDSDLNTAYGTTVEPLPYHAIHTYPYGPGDAYPSDSAHMRYRREYNTRVVPACHRACARPL